MASKLEEINDPELREAIKEACESQYSGWLYGGSAVKAETKSQISDVMRELQGRKREAEQMRESLALRMSAMGLGMSDIPSLPDKITRESMEKYRDEMQRYSDKIRVESERQHNPHFQEITRNLSKGSGGLVCPVCGEGDHGNKGARNIPICYMNWKHGGLGPIQLVKPEDVKDWKPPKKKPKIKSFTFKEPDGVVRK